MLAEVPRPVAATAVSKRFGWFKVEVEKAVRVPKIIEDQTQKQIIEAWLNVRWKHQKGVSKEDYMGCLKEIRDIRYTAKDVEKFSIMLEIFKESEDFAWRAGLYLSALINNCPENDFAIHIGHIDKKIESIGYQNTKNITVDGDAGNYLAIYMAGGRITVEGNTGIAGQWMENGEIVINGNCGRFLGYGMKGGKIAVKGNTEDGVGLEMENGEITINGNCGNTLGQQMKGGKIIVKKNAGDNVGHMMEGGELRVEGEHEGLSKYTFGGKIYHKWERVPEFWVRIGRKIRHFLGRDKDAG